MPFAALGLPAALLRGVRAAGYQTPTPIQARAIPLVLEGVDVVAAAQTARAGLCGAPELVHDRIDELLLDRRQCGDLARDGLLLLGRQGLKQLGAMIGSEREAQDRTLLRAGEGVEAQRASGRAHLLSASQARSTCVVASGPGSASRR